MCLSGTQYKGLGITKQRRKEERKDQKEIKRSSDDSRNGKTKDREHVTDG